jgi:hypothetical protein
MIFKVPEVTQRGGSKGRDWRGTEVGESVMEAVTFLVARKRVGRVRGRRMVRCGLGSMMNAIV